MAPKVQDDIMRRARAEYLEMPGLRLTVPQASRLWGLDAVVCDALLTCLEASGFLRQTTTGAFRLAASDGGIPRVLRRRSAIDEGQALPAASISTVERLS